MNSAFGDHPTASQQKAARAAEVSVSTANKDLMQKCKFQSTVVQKSRDDDFTLIKRKQFTELLLEKHRFDVNFTRNIHVHVVFI